MTSSSGAVCSADIWTAAPGFWAVGGYKNNVRRVGAGVEQLDDMAKMVKERADIEATYAKLMRRYEEKWRTHVEKAAGPGTVRDVWQLILGEAASVAIQHERIRERLMDDLARTLVQYIKDNHHPSAFRAPKEEREVEEGFEKAQKQWRKLYEKTESARRSYYTACQSERSAQNALSNAQADTSLSPDAAQKLRSRFEKAQEDVTKTRTNYVSSLEEIQSYQAPYIEQMSFVFEKCQQSELRRSKFVVEMLGGLQQVLSDLAHNNKLSIVHTQLEDRLRSSDERQLREDLVRWSEKYGAALPLIAPTFEDYTPEMRHISTRRKDKENSGVVLTRQILKDEALPAAASPQNTSATQQQQQQQGWSPVRKSQRFEEELSKRAAERRTAALSARSVQNLSTGDEDDGLRSRGHTASVLSSAISTHALNTCAVGRAASGFSSTNSQASSGQCTPSHTDSSSGGGGEEKPTKREQNGHSHHHPKIGVARSTGGASSAVRNSTPDVDVELESTRSKSVATKSIDRLSPSDDGVVMIQTNQSSQTRHHHHHQHHPPHPAATIIAAVSVQPEFARAVALYDYAAVEDDEMDLHKGFTVELLSEADALGWRMARAGSRQGLVPASYVKPIA